MALSPTIKLALCAFAVATTVQVSVGRPSVSSNMPCNKAADIIFLVDTSSSIWPGFFNNNVKTFLKDVISSFKIGPGPLDTRVGVTLFSSREYLDFHLNQYQTVEDVVQAVNDLRYRGGDTYTHRALEFVSNEMLTPEHGSREGVAKLVVVLTDGKSIDEEKTSEAARFIKEKGASIFAIGVGKGVDFDELYSMASEPRQKFVYPVTDFRALDGIKDNFKQSTCDVLSPTTLVPTVTTTTSTTTTSTTITTPMTSTATTTTTTTPTPTTPSTTTSTAAPRTTTPGDPFLGDGTFNERCRGKPADIYFLLDASSSVWIGHFHDRVLPFVRDLVSSFQISPLHTRVGLVTFSNEVNHEFGLSSHTDLKSLHEAIQPESVDYLTGSTNTGDAIEYVTKRGFGAGEARDGVAQIIITVTDGLSQLPKKTAQAALEAKKQGVYMFAVGVGKFVDEKELSDISSNPDEDFVFSVNDFKALNSITSLLALKTCKAVTKDDSKFPSDQIECPKAASNVMFLYEYLNSASPSKVIVEDFISQFTYDASAIAPQIKVGILTQPCVGGVTSLQSVVRFQEALSQIRSNYYVGFPNLVKKLRTEIFSRVSLTEQRVAVLVLDEMTRNLDVLEREVMKLKLQNVNVIIVAVGKVKEAMLERLASTPKRDHVIRVDSYSQMRDSKLDILRMLCGKAQRDGLVGVDETNNKPTSSRIEKSEVIVSGDVKDEIKPKYEYEKKVVPTAVITHDKTTQKAYKKQTVTATDSVDGEWSTTTDSLDTTWPASGSDSEDSNTDDRDNSLDFDFDVIPN